MARRRYNLYIYTLLIFSICQPELLYSSHYWGGDITWECVGHDKYIVTLTLYRDCNWTNMGNKTINFKCKTTGATILSKTTARPAPTDITPTCDETCTRCDTRSCTFAYGIQKFVYNSGIVNLSNAASCCEIIISFEDCCRTSIITIVMGRKDLHLTACLNRCLSQCDNSPVFSNNGAVILCVGQDAAINFHAIDIDSNSNGSPIDKLVYSVTDPRGKNGSYLYYSSPYSKNNPIFYWGFPDNTLPFPRGFHLNPNTGLMEFRPMKIESTVIAIKVAEYRNGIYIGEITRDIIVVVINCPSNHPPVLSGPYYKEVCPGDTVIFTINSNDYDPNDSIKISWDNAITNASWTDNNGVAKHPSATFTWIPDSSDISILPYSFSVYAQDDACAVFGQTTKVYEILVKHNRPYATLNFSDLYCGDYYFSAAIESGVNPEYIWTGIEGKTYFTQNFHHTFRVQGSYPFKLTLIDTAACKTDTVVYYDTVIGNTFLDVELPSDTQICFGNTLTIQGKHFNANGNYQYHWNTGETTQQITIGPIFSDTMLVLKVTDTTWCSDSDTMYINAVSNNTNLEVKLPGDRLLCLGDSLTINGQVYYPNGNYHYQWSTGDTTDQITIGPLVTDTIIIVRVTDATLCSDSDYMFINLNYMTLDIGDDQAICEYEQASFMANIFTEAGTWINSIKWNRVGVPNILSYNSILNTSTSGKYVCIVTNNNGCQAKDTAKLTVNNIPVIIIDPIPVQCIDGFTLRLNKYVNPKGGQWICPGSGMIQPDVIIPSTAGKGEFWAYYDYTDPITSCENADSIKIFISELPDTSIIITSDTLIAIEGMLSYDWFKDGNQVNNNSNILIADESGYYYLIITDSNGCKNTSSTHYVYVKPDNVDEFLLKNTFIVYPNPSNGKFTISLNKSLKDDFHIKLFNLLGVEIETIPLFKGITDFEVDLRNYPKGIYFIEVVNGSDLKFFRKIILN